MSDYNKHVHRRDMSQTSSDNDENNSNHNSNYSPIRSEHQLAVRSSKKPRGRPPGSKNKPKPPIIITRESDSVFKPAVINVASGSDLIDMVVQYARRRSVAVTLLGGSGTISSITLRSTIPTMTPVSLMGPLNILSLSGTYLLSGGSNGNAGGGATSFGVTLTGPNGSVYGGIVGGAVVAASEVRITVATFKDPVLHALPADFDEDTAAMPAAAPVAAAAGGGVIYSHVPLTAAKNRNVSSQEVLSWGTGGGGGGSSHPPSF